MRTYELMYIVDPKVPEDEAIALADSVKELVKTHGGTITKDESWGRRKLAYTIRKQNEGRYYLIYAHTPDDSGVNVAAVEHRLEQNDKILRFLTVRTDGDIQRVKGKVTAELAAGIVPEVVPEVAPEVVPEVVAEVAPAEVAPPVVVAETAPEAAPEAVPDVAADAVVEAAAAAPQGEE